MQKIFLIGITTIFMAAVIAGDCGASSLSTLQQVTHVPPHNDFRPWPRQASSNSLSKDGRFMVFQASESDMVPGDTNNVTDVFLYDRVTKKTERLSVTSAGQQGNDTSFDATISADGRYVSFITKASNLVDVKCGKKCSVVVVLDRQTKQMTPASLSTLGLPLIVNEYDSEFGENAVISADGNFVVFESPSAVSPLDTNGTYDVLVRDLHARVTRLASLGAQDQVAESGSWDGTISADGRYVVFSTINRLVADDFNGASDIYMRDMQLGTTELISRNYKGEVTYAGRRDSYDPAVSADGRFVTFVSQASDLIKTDNSGMRTIFLRNVKAKTTTRVTNAEYGVEPNGHSYAPSVSADGSYVVYESYASNLVKADDNKMSDIYIYYRVPNVTRKVPQLASTSKLFQGWPQQAVVSGDGKTVSYLGYSAEESGSYLSAMNLFVVHDPVAHLPFYDEDSIIDLF